MARDTRCDTRRRRALLDRGGRLLRAALDERGDEVHGLQLNAEVREQRVRTPRLERHVLPGVGRDVDACFVVDVFVRGARMICGGAAADAAPGVGRDARAYRLGLGVLDVDGDRKSTRLNSSHLGISYAVFCLKKKNP